MHFLRTCAAAAALLTVCSLLPVSAEPMPVNDEGYDLTGFAYQWPEVFSKDDTVTVTEDSYQSHDVSIKITTHTSNRITGDLDEDGTVKVSDAVMLSRCIAEDPNLPVTETSLLNADVNEDGDIGLTDLAMTLEYLGKTRTAEEYLIDHAQCWHIVDVHVRYLDSLRGAFAQGHFPETGSGGNKTISAMAQENNAIFAINCDYCELRNNGITYRNGVMYRETKRDEVAIIYRDGVMDVLTDAEYRLLTDEEKANIWQTTAFAPGLVKDGNWIRGFRSTVRVERHNRSGIGYYEPGHYVFVQADGRLPGYANGLTCEEFGRIFYELGCSEAYNMDGGSSSEIVFMGKTFNTPSGVQIGSYGGRPSSDILYLCELADIPAEE